MAIVAREQIVLLDSNILIEIANTETWKHVIDEHSDLIFVISAVSVMELYALAGMSEAEEKRIDQIVGYLRVAAVTRSIAKGAGRLSRTRQKRHRADALIAATALEFAIPLITRNVKDFKNIPGLVVRTAL